MSFFLHVKYCNIIKISITFLSSQDTKKCAPALTGLVLVDAQSLGDFRSTFRLKLSSSPFIPQRLKRE